MHSLRTGHARFGTAVVNLLAQDPKERLDVCTETKLVKMTNLQAHNSVVWHRVVILKMVYFHYFLESVLYSKSERTLSSSSPPHALIHATMHSFDII